MQSRADSIVPEIRKVFCPESQSFIEKAETPRFIKGPIPYEWMKKANQLRGKAGSVGLALWFLSGVNRAKRFKVTRAVEDLTRADRKTIYRAIDALEAAGLIMLERSEGTRPVVTLLD